MNDSISPGGLPFRALKKRKMRKRSIPVKVKKTDGEEEETVTQVCTSACQSLMDSLIAVDQQLTARLAVCATKESSLGHLRPIMKILEISCHGIPWILGPLLLFSVSHKPQDVTVSVNLLGGESYRVIYVNLKPWSRGNSKNYVYCSLRKKQLLSL